ncbi:MULTISPECIES: SulP family inorganic anion transporter [Erythrobacteraceae]|jgi:sulfate permease, SulP family|uniref:Sulfate: proton symporter n=6 Tax=Alphaproteobacteria TaxID=28211 RepID=A0A160HUM2_9SPHN|nr:MULTISPECIES: sulfate permease [Erythrobacteraceae]KZX87091.1 sodium-independent anion transporter [Erythrobacter sp. HI0020]KZY15611.1 sodium-independent anion transporter [Erythrobacter sp. HI0037]KZY16971.1 sodium-independent anion transporter [Erythrobacter sp. HI0038]ANC50687.1 sulfate: proton symporter [Aurantiacibacter atlanticus]MDP4540388.1 sulfate permease [Qipengyuania sp. DY56-A-20]
MAEPTLLARYLPILQWGRTYNGSVLTNDLVAAVIVTIMLIPQSLAYALLAGLPPVVGLYASILPLVAYALFGTSRTLAVGPVAVLSLMTASAAGAVAAQDTAEYLEAAITLAALSGIMLAVLGFLRLGFLANLLSHPVISGFITASGILIATSQIKHILGISGGGDNWPEMLGSLASNIGLTNPWTLAIGIPATLFLFWVRGGLKPALLRIGLKPRAADIAAKAGPVIAVALTILAAVMLDLAEKGVDLVGAIPQGLPPFATPSTDMDLIAQLWVPALLISVIGFVESVSVAQTLAAKRRQRIAPDQELIGLGASNIASAFSGGYPVTGGFARSVVNFDAGAETPAAGAYTAIGIALASLFLTPLLFSLPIATLAATIIVAVLSLVDLKTPGQLWRYSKADFAAHLATIVTTLLAGVELGVITGVVVGLLLYLWRASRPHAAIVGRVPETEHFRNVERHDVFTVPHVLSIRIDESLTYLNARWLEEYVLERVADQPEVRHVILMCSAVNEVDASGLESLEAINHRLSDSGIDLHLSEVKGPVMDRLKRTEFLEKIGGRVFLSQNRAFRELSRDNADPSLPDDIARGLI